MTEKEGGRGRTNPPAADASAGCPGELRMVVLRGADRNLRVASIGRSHES